VDKKEGFRVFSNILVPLDGTAESNTALPLARTVVKETGGAVTLLRVVRPGDAAMAQEARAELGRIVVELTGSVGRVHSAVVESSDVAGSILDSIDRLRIDLVIMRTHGRAGLNRAILGSVTQDVLASSAVPVMLVRPGGRRITQLRKLMVPIDGSPGGSLALGTAVELSRTTGASLKLLEVAVPAASWMYPGDGYGGMAYYDPVWDEEALAGARAYVDGVVARLRAADVEADGAARQERMVAESIVQAADAAESDLIVMSTRALTGPARAILGSTADAVVRGAHCPVLLIHRQEAAGEVFSEFAPEAIAVAPL
jgi:nucleotide-binding universal stress UspA family protein